MSDPANRMVVITVYNWDRLSHNQFMGQVMEDKKCRLFVGWGLGCVDVLVYNGGVDGSDNDGG